MILLNEAEDTYITMANWEETAWLWWELFVL